VTEPASDPERIRDMLLRQRRFFATGATRDVEFRRERLRDLGRAIDEGGRAMSEALRADLRKSAAETFLTEIFLVKNEIRTAVRRLRRWARPRRVRPPLYQRPAACEVRPEPYGTALILAPWNYPVQLTLSPLVGAIAAGNCCVVKPSELAPASSAAIRGVIERAFEPELAAVVEGGADTARCLLSEGFDRIFYSGGPDVGRLVMRAAADGPTPVTLELGGKNPCVVDRSADLAATGRRIAWGKLLNAGQSCVAPDYALVHREVKDALVAALADAVRDLYGDDPSRSPDYGRIASQRHFERLLGLMSQGTVVLGGETDPGDLYIAPTLMERPEPGSALAREEIFGPILPIVEWGDVEEAIAEIRSRPAPLALYVFASDRGLADAVLDAVPSGGACVNDVISHMANDALPFGGVGPSGMGAYHGKASFDTFTHYRSVMRKGFALDLPVRYPPYEKRRRWLEWLSRLYR